MSSGRSRETWAKRPPFVGAYKKGRLDAFNGDPMKAPYVNRGWGHQFMTAYDTGYREVRRELAGQRRLALEEDHD